VRDREQKRRIAELWRVGAAWYRDTIGAAPPRPGEDEGQRQRSNATAQYMLDHIEDMPAIIFVAVKKDEVVAKTLQSPNTITAATPHPRRPPPPRARRPRPPPPGPRQRRRDRRPRDRLPGGAEPPPRRARARPRRGAHDAAALPSGAVREGARPALGRDPHRR